MIRAGQMRHSHSMDIAAQPTRQVSCQGQATRHTLTTFSSLSTTTMSSDTITWKYSWDMSSIAAVMRTCSVQRPAWHLTLPTRHWREPSSWTQQEKAETAHTNQKDSSPAGSTITTRNTSAACLTGVMLQAALIRTIDGATSTRLAVHGSSQKKSS